MRYLLAIPIALFFCLACGEEPPAEEDAAASAAPAEVEATRLELPAELDGALAGRTIVVCVGSHFYDPEFYDVRRLLSASGARLLVASTGGRLFGLGGSEILVDLQLDELDETVEYDALYLMQSRGMERLANLDSVHRLVRRTRESGALVAASGIAVEALARAGVLDGVRAAPYRAKRQLCEDSGAVIVDEDDVVLDQGVGTATFWPQGGRLALELIAALAAS